MTLNLRKRIALFFGLLLGCSAAFGQGAGYDQMYRPQVHFSPEQHWTNDPNGLLYFAGEYHLFYQYNPFGDEWGHMSWGHAVSKDLVHWDELPVAIPEADGKMIYTGSVVVDHGNTSGLCGSDAECLVAVYTANSNPGGKQLETQELAYSRDRGRTWTKYAKNPVLDLKMEDFRDPSVFRDEAHGRWLMAVALPKEHKVLFFSSLDLKDWTKASEFGPAGATHGDWECPDLLQIPAANGKGTVWALKVGLNPGAPQGGSGEQYFLGSFDGKSFAQSPETGSHGWTNYGKDDYCAISFNGLPKGQQPLLLGWMSNWQYAAKLPTSPWRGQMSLARRLSYVKDADGLALRQSPVVDSLRGRRLNLTQVLGSQKTNLPAPYELDLRFAPRATGRFGLRITTDAEHWTDIGFDTAKGEFFIDRTHSGQTIAAEFPAITTAPLASNRPNTLKLIVDRSSVEAYAQDGSIVMTDLIFPTSLGSTVQLFATDGPVVHPTGEGWILHSIWGQQQVHRRAPLTAARPALGRNADRKRRDPAVASLQ